LQPIEEESGCGVGVQANRMSLSQSAVGNTKLTTPQTDGMGADGERQRLIDETIGQHFGTQPVWVDIESISDGQMNLVVWEKVDEGTRRNLLDCCNGVIEEFAAQPYSGRETNALLMDMAAKRFNTKHGEYPKCWLKVLHDLKRVTNTSLG